MSTSIDLNSAKNHIEEILGKPIDSLNMDTIAKVWEKWEIVPRFSIFEGRKLKIKCELWIETHKFYNDLRAISSEWENYFMASLDAILLIKFQRDQKEFKR